MTSVHLIAAARPNFMKVAPLYHELKRTSWCEPMIVHTGQHYDANMSDSFFDELQLPPPDIHLGIGSGSHAEQTAGVMTAYEKIILDKRPDWIVVVGDVNSTMAVTLSAKKLLIPVAHLEAGLRSGDRTMPEEINRLVTDAIVDVLWTPSPDADENLRNEGVAESKISNVGNIMIDSYELLREQIEAGKIPEKFNLQAGKYGVVTLHRPSNVDDQDTLARLTDYLCQVAQETPLVFALHPRTRKNLEGFNLFNKLNTASGLQITPPLSYIQFMGLVRDSKFLITDSGGVQEETSYLGIPCVTLRDTTERPITVTMGTNKLANPDQLLGCISDISQGAWPQGQCPPQWDGKTAQRVAEDLFRRINAN
jgi:UDP-N-acetylglucosamine 2-epimerase (non-hydrolysing)